MGQTLSEPVVEKKSHHGQDDRVLFGVSAMQGWRISMEDAHTTVLDLQAPADNEKFQPASADVRISFFGVYDGHGGDKVALYAGRHLHEIVANQDPFKSKDFEQALKDGFLAIDRAILSDPKYEEEVSGCTASVSIVTHDKIFVANAGDSRSVLGIKGRAKPLSFDHKPQNEAEKARICEAGGFVDFGRVNGNLALSRAIGDFEFKKSAHLPPEKQIVTVYPDVTTHNLCDDDEFLVVACDGIWDCQSSQAVVEFVRRGIAAKQELQSICENMMDNCLAANSDAGGVGCDNMTMVVVGLLNGKTKEAWYDMVAERVANAEFRGPGTRHRLGDSQDDFGLDMEHRTRVLGGGPNGGRVIIFGDGRELPNTEYSSDEDEDVDMADRDDAEEEDKDPEQVRRGKQTATNGDTERTQREATPEPAAVLANSTASDSDMALDSTADPTTSQPVSTPEHIDTKSEAGQDPSQKAEHEEKK